MIFSALFSFLGGSAFRMIWGEVANWLNKAQDHAFEVQRLSMQADYDAAQHERNMTALKLQSDLGVKTIETQATAAVDTAEADAFTEAMKNAFKPTGIAVVDIWNGVIRPAAATIALILWVSKLYAQGGEMQPWDMDLMGSILGFFFADRSLAKQNK